MNLFNSNSYKEILREILQEKKRTVSRQFSFQNLAQACRVQKTYLSKVLHSDKTHLSADQLFLAMEFLGLTEAEKAYVSLLHERDRAALPARQKWIQRKITEIRRLNRKTESHLSATAVRPEALEGEELTEYYLNPDLQLIHVFLTVEKYASDPRLIKDALQLSESAFSAALSSLARAGIVALREGRYVVLRESLHLSADSPLLSPYRALLRFRSMERLRSVPKERSYTFSVVFSSSEEARRRIQERFFSFIREVEAEAKGSRPENVYQLNFDLLPWS